jgi:hypothetical protein
MLDNCLNLNELNGKVGQFRSTDFYFVQAVVLPISEIPMYPLRPS